MFAVFDTTLRARSVLAAARARLPRVNGMRLSYGIAMMNVARELCDYRITEVVRGALAGGVSELRDYAHAYDNYVCSR